MIAVDKAGFAAIVAVLLGLGVLFFVLPRDTFERPNPVVQVRVVSIAPYDSNWSRTIHAHTTVERLDTKERVILMGDTWGTTGEVFGVRESKL